ncbi:hypothetical protein [Bacteriovorax sp. Seq25_V]|uniref:hypothetical protein n=1 Tax=Bacteriovorax sp. Seq25_V TaxID=1201288 RepID=UPI00038A0186|nr:hypothetical protein [Bacteriovorax sp. Seq25_V]EQC44319.1 hypothetical protein M900_A0484 [Bacteriovorax sp. Seq25_V]
MKLLVTLLVSILALGGTGGISGGSKPGKGKIGIGPDSSWTQVRDAVKKNWNLQISGDYVFTGYPNSAFQVCIDGDEFRTIEKRPQYERRRVSRHLDNDGDRDGYTNVIVGYEYDRYPLVYESWREVCNNHDKNCKRVPITVNQTTVKNVKIKYIVESRGGRDNDRKVEKELFDKDYVIPYCEN